MSRGGGGWGVWCGQTGTLKRLIKYQNISLELFRDIELPIFSRNMIRNMNFWKYKD